eukprot:GHVN01060828.1.p1 GENE.GHVN01060828.1~~GHVN01060828.1.p1  ORF type:complete len:189 (-),score=61.83 GHVN01060828.1:32-598(-)
MIHLTSLTMMCAMVKKPIEAVVKQIRPAYQDWMSATLKAFGPDHETREKVRDNMRKEMRRRIDNGAPSEELIKDLTEATDFARYHLVQARATPTGFSVKVTPNHMSRAKDKVIDLRHLDGTKLGHEFTVQTPVGRRSRQSPQSQDSFFCHKFRHIKVNAQPHQPDTLHSTDTPHSPESPQRDQTKPNQ